MNVQGEKVLGAQRTDSMVHPDYRRRGIFLSLAKECYTLAEKEGARLLYGFPNAQSYPAVVNRLDSIDLGEFPELLKILNLKRVLRDRVYSNLIASIGVIPVRLTLSLFKKGDRQPKPPGQITITPIDHFDQRFDDLWLRTKNQFNVSLWKDSASVR